MVRALLICPKKKKFKKIASEILKIVCDNCGDMHLDHLYSFSFNY